ncbi:MAG: hypothetical protein ABIR50_01240 [Ginsengibacter sp.]
MKINFKLFVIAVGVTIFLASCSGTKSPSSARHNRGVNNSHYQGY